LEASKPLLALSLDSGSVSAIAFPVHAFSFQFAKRTPALCYNAFRDQAKSLLCGSIEASLQSEPFLKAHGQ